MTSELFDIKVPQLGRFTAAYQGAGRIVTDELKRAGRESGLLVQRPAMRRAPVKTGHGRRSIAVGAQKATAAAVTTPVGTSVPYMRFHDEGTGIYGPKGTPIRARGGGMLSWVGANGKRVFARAVRGVPARKFLTGTFAELKPQIRQIHAKVPGRVIARLAAGGR